MEKKEELLRDKLKTVVAGESICWNDFERYMARAKPLTFSTLLKAVRAESYLSATQDKVLTSGMKIAIGTIFAVMIVVAVVWLILTSGG